MTVVQMRLEELERLKLRILSVILTCYSSIVLNSQNCKMLKISQHTQTYGHYGQLRLYIIAI